jgi:thiosulfate dehydrogenase [quinone] large subunit
LNLILKAIFQELVEIHLLPPVQTTLSIRTQNPYYLGVNTSMKSWLFGPTYVENPKMINTLFSTTRFSWLWLIIRVYVGVQWLSASVVKLSSPAWMQSGEALRVFWANSVVVPPAPASPVIYYGWFRNLIQLLLDQQSYVWFAKFIAIGEFMVGLALVLGFMVGVTAFFGGVMHLGLLLEGSLGAAPILLVLEILLIIAWKTAGYYGLDRYFFKFIGAPWSLGRWFQKKPA